LITAETLSPTFSASSSTASLVIDEVTVSPEASSTFTCAVVDPFVTATTLPGRMLRALSFIFAFLFLDRGCRRHAQFLYCGWLSDPSCFKRHDAHEKALNDAGVASASIQTAVRFAAMIQSVAMALEAGAIGLAVAAE